MDYQIPKIPISHIQSNLTDENEKERVLMQYAGIFKRNITEFASKVIPKLKKKKNLSK